jgi:tetratricopeptide (TPR) repeat protein
VHNRTSESVAQPLIRVPLLAPSPRGWRVHLGAGLLIAVMVAAVYWPTLRNGFLSLGFDDALILDTAAIHELSASSLWTMFAGFNQAPYYMPFTLLSLAVDYHVWQVDPFGYHLTNVVLQAATAILAYVFLVRLLGSARPALMAALIFAVHPVQMEAVSVAVQRKTMLAGAFFFVTLICYQHWRRQGGRRYYGAALAAFALAALAKPAVVALPGVLLLYDYTFVGRARVRTLLPFAGIAAAVGWLAMRAHATLGALYPPHGGHWFANLLMVSRVQLEYADALILPVNLSPIYYYPTAIVYSPLNVLALVALATAGFWVTRSRRRYPWSFFCFWWAVLVLLPESNVVPLAQLRADRYLYFAVLPFALLVVIGLSRMDHLTVRGWPLGTGAAAPLCVGLLAVLCYGSAGVWRDDVSAWRRAVERHPWCGVAYGMLGKAYYERGEGLRAETSLREAVRLSARDPEVYLYLARVYAQSDRQELAQAEVEQFLRLAPNDAAGTALLAALTRPGP